MIQNYDEAINYIHSRYKWSRINTFARIKMLLDFLGNPQNKLQYVHITGTNGKGSVARMTEQLLMEHGLKVGLFTSPFIMRFNERIQINNKSISDKDLIKIMQKIELVLKDVSPEMEPTEFEILTALMFVYFSQNNLDVVVLEAGIGGTWDTTNIINNKLVAVITTIGLDHQKVLGKTIEKITDQKVGIIKNNQQLTVIGRLPDLSVQAVSRSTRQLYNFGEEFKLDQIEQNQYGEWIFTWCGQSNLQFKNLVLPLLGLYQLDNVAVAIETMILTLQALNHPIQEKNIQIALNNIKWPVRFEKISKDPDIILDGAHNLDGIKALINTINKIYSKQLVVVIISILEDKNYMEMLSELLKEPLIKVIIVEFVAPNKRHSINPKNVVNKFSNNNISIGEDWESSVQKELLRNPYAKIIISGSLYFVAEVRKIWLTKHHLRRKSNGKNKSTSV